jgi:hypothetical protein
VFLFVSLTINEHDTFHQTVSDWAKFYQFLQHIKIYDGEKTASSTKTAGKTE